MGFDKSEDSKLFNVFSLRCLGNKEHDEKLKGYYSVINSIGKIAGIVDRSLIGKLNDKGYSFKKKGDRDCPFCHTGREYDEEELRARVKELEDTVLD